MTNHHHLRPTPFMLLLEILFLIVIVLELLYFAIE